MNIFQALADILIFRKFMLWASTYFLWLSKMITAFLIELDPSVLCKYSKYIIIKTLTSKKVNWQVKSRLKLMFRWQAKEYNSKGYFTKLSNAGMYDHPILRFKLMCQPYGAVGYQGIQIKILQTLKCAATYRLTTPPWSRMLITIIMISRGCPK